MLAVAAWFGVVGLIVNAIVSPSDESSVAGAVFGTVSAYTWQSNLFVALWLTAALRPAGGPSRWLSPVIHGAITVYISVTFLVFALVLEGLWDPVGLLLVLSIVTHYVVPIAFIADWLLFAERRSHRWDFVWRWFTYPLAYLVFALVRGAIVGDYIYPFLDVDELGWSGVAVSVMVLSAFLAILGAGFVAVNRRLPIDQSASPSTARQ